MENTTGCKKGQIMTEIVFNGQDIAYQMEESNNIKEFNSVRFWVNGKEINSLDLKLVFYNDEEQNEELSKTT